MDVTIKEIAEMCGVSRGTVDRVLHNRGNVSKETAALVKDAIEKLEYTPNVTGKILAAKKTGFKIGVILISKGNPFFDDVLEGIDKAKKDFKQYGVSVFVYELEGYNVDKQIEKMDELKDQVDAIILNPINDVLVVEKINELVKKGLIVINVNTDVENSNRLYYIGSDYIKGGETSCGVLALLTKAKANVAILTGSKKVLGHNQRIEGFKRISELRYPDINIVAISETNDSDKCGYIETIDILKKHDINSIVIVAAGVGGVCKAVKDMELEDKITIVSFDAVPITREMLKEGIIKATICQQPFTQGYKSIELAYNYFVTGKRLNNDKYIVKNEIRILENL
ncbi:LacI family DNA-binding transcriptional regulator [Anaerosalibacter sp. Marseille-P3206]|uniref:LacI family DNA-binding transcriptional regulator n=1 Tax=Anaerosalibacter sp. Marseille-P3206 TaxID=1871005 RepID=UPI0013564404|nr:LacI family DNA-binding transcriptional regulator [Anaerosalibacter sp. Marseille-P3206]